MFAMNQPPPAAAAAAHGVQSSAAPHAPGIFINSKTVAHDTASSVTATGQFASFQLKQEDGRPLAQVMPLSSVQHLTQQAGAAHGLAGQQGAQPHHVLHQLQQQQQQQNHHHHQQQANVHQATGGAQDSLSMDSDIEAYVSIKQISPNRVKYTCNACQFSPKDLALLIEHVNGIHLKRKNIACTLCDFKTSKRKSLTAHFQEAHVKEKRFQCNLCGFKCARKTGLEKHMQTKHMPLHKCLHCSEFSSKRESDLKLHMMQKHNIKEVLTFNAPDLSTNHNHAVGAAAGLSTESLPIQISVVPDQAAALRQVAVGQVTTAAKAEPTQSDEKTSVNLEQYITLDHSLPNKHACTLCKYSPVSMRYLRDHIRKVHLSKLIKCTHCDLKTKRRADLLKHMRRLHPEAVAAAAAAAAQQQGGFEAQQQLQQALSSHGHPLPVQHAAQQQQQPLAQMPEVPPIQIPIVKPPSSNAPLSSTLSGTSINVPQVPTMTPVMNLSTSGSSSSSAINDAAQGKNSSATDLLNIQPKQEVPNITFQISYPAPGAGPNSTTSTCSTTLTATGITLPQVPVLPTQLCSSGAGSISTLDTSQLYSGSSNGTTTLTLSAPVQGGNHSQQLHLQTPGGASGGSVSNPRANLTSNSNGYKKGQVDNFGPNVKCDDLISYSDNYAHGLGCMVCNYAPQTLRYLRDHIRKVHLAKLYKCPNCDLRTKRRADLVRHIKRIHEDPKRSGLTPQQQPATHPQQHHQPPAGLMTTTTTSMQKS